MSNSHSHLFPDWVPKLATWSVFSALIWALVPELPALSASQTPSRD